MNKNWITTCLAMFSAAWLTACGGGGGEAAEPVTPLPQGVWTASQADSKMAVLVLPDSYDGTVWAIEETQQKTTVYKASLKKSGKAFKGEGSLIESESNTVSPLVQVELSSNSKPSTTLSYTVKGKPATQLTYTTEFDAPATLADWTGAWEQRSNGGHIGFQNMEWTLAANGTIAGRRDGGCTYTGHIALRQENRSAVDVVVQEQCPGTTAVQYWGYGLPRRDSSGALEGRDVTILRADGLAVSILKFWPASTDL